MAAAILAAPGQAAPPSGSCLAVLAATYEARHMEMGGGIKLRPDGRFRYELSYGALDEEADGRWTCDGTSVFLTSDPVKSPRFETVSLGAGSLGQLHITLDVPEGMSHQYFSVLIRRPDGTVERQQFAEDGLTIAFSAKARPVAILPVLPVFEFAGDPIDLPPGDGIELHLRFTPNDLGKVAFAQTPLKRDGKTLLLERFNETIRFERAGS